MVRYPKQNRLSLDDIETMKIRTLTGNKVPLSSLAELQKEEVNQSSEELKGLSYSHCCRYR